MPSSLSRRQVLMLLSFLSAGTTAASAPFIGKFFTNKANAQTIYTRENIATFAQSPEKIAALKRGIQVMQSRRADDPTSWIYQANMHGTTDRPLRTAWNTCAHGSFFFFPWHRMYLYFFERILRQASGDPNLALPYWNYSDFPDQRILPEPFRIPADPSTNPLYVRERGSGINEGTTGLADREVDYGLAFQRTNFFHTTTTGQSFGGRRVSQTTHLTSDSRTKGQLERRPHDQVHVVVGGSSGWMRNVNLSARDPIFWLHHANIDRLWERWLQQGSGRANPTNNRDWMNDPFTFFDADGTQVTQRGRDIIDIVQQLNYRYEDVQAVAGNEVQLRSNTDGDDLLPHRTAVATQPLAATSVGDQEVSIELTLTQLTLTLPFMQAQGSRLLVDRSQQGRPLSLNVEGIEFNPSNAIPYEIYINLPPGVTPDRNSPYYVGRLALFALRQKGTFSIDITDLVRELHLLNATTTGDSISVTFVPPSEEVTKFKRTGRPVKVFQGGVRFRRVSVTITD